MLALLYSGIRATTTPKRGHMMSSLTPDEATPGVAGQSSRRTGFRVLGGLLMVAALVLIGIAVADFFSVFGSDDFDAQPTKFWMFFVALPLFAIGGFFLQLGFAGAGARYLAREYVPVLKESLDELGVGSSSATGPFCRSCGRRNDTDARFCDGCGTAMGTA